MAKKTDKAVQDVDESSTLSSLEEMILRIRFGLGKNADSDSFERSLNDDLRKKLQFLELKAFEQSGRINELLSDIEKKRQRK